MIPIGFLPKIIQKKPDWLNSNIVKEICSLSLCTSKTPNEYINDWKHNDFSLFNTEELAINSVKNKNSNFDLFYYEIYEKELNEGKWTNFKFEKLNIIKNEEYKFIGYDIVCFSYGNNFDCSPLSCNHGAEKIEVNEYCLIENFEKVVEAIEYTDKYKYGESGPYRIVSVYRKLKI